MCRRGLDHTGQRPKLPPPILILARSRRAICVCRVLTSLPSWKALGWMRWLVGVRVLVEGELSRAGGFPCSVFFVRIYPSVALFSLIFDLLSNKRRWHRLSTSCWPFMRGTTHPETQNSLLFLFLFSFFFSYSILIFGWVPALFHPLEFVTQGAPEPRDVRMRYNPGGASTESQFPGSPEWVTTKDHPPSTPALV